MVIVVCSPLLKQRSLFHHLLHESPSRQFYKGNQKSIHGNHGLFTSSQAKALETSLFQKHLQQSLDGHTLLEALYNSVEQFLFSPPQKN